MSDIKGRHRSRANGREYTYFAAVRPAGKEIWTAHVYCNSHLVCVLARGIVEAELSADDLTAQICGQVMSHIDSLR
jgi:hypothetical protein